MYLLNAPAHIHTSILLPSSKSISNRLLIMNALVGDVAQAIQNISTSDDSQVMVKALEQAKKPNLTGETLIDIGAAGTAMRFLTAFLSQKEGNWVITGTDRIKKRPIRPLVQALNQLGADVNYAEEFGFPPLLIKGRKLHGGHIILDSSISSQFISALLMIAPYMEQGIDLQLEGSAISRPYVEMTLGLMEEMGIAYEYSADRIKVAPQQYNPITITVESDWSAASYWFAITALCCEQGAVIELPNLNLNSLQGDSKVAQLFEPLGVNTKYTGNGITISRQEKSLVSSWEYNFVNEPDLAQTFVVCCCLLDIPFRFTGLSSLRIKETDRILALKQEMKKIGYILQTSDETIQWQGEQCDPQPDPLIETYEDHRMAMAFAPACIKMKNLKINHPEVVSKSYPHFWSDLIKAGFEVQEI